jgi:hypothetical protein
MSVMGIKIPDIKTRVIDGIRYDTYPSGKIIAQKEGESPEEKEERKIRADERKEAAQIRVSEEKLKNTNNLKIKNEIDKVVPHMQSAWDAANLLRLLIKESKQGGPAQGRLANLGFINNETLGAMNALSGIVQSNASKSAVARPSGLSLGWAKQFKTDITKPWKYNLGQANGIITDLRSDYDNQRKQYKESTGLDLPEFKKFDDNDPLIKQAFNAINKGADINQVLERLQQLRGQRNGP